MSSFFSGPGLSCSCSITAGSLAEDLQAPVTCVCNSLLCTHPLETLLGLCPWFWRLQNSLHGSVPLLRQPWRVHQSTFSHVLCSLPLCSTSRQAPEHLALLGIYLLVCVHISILKDPKALGGAQL